MQNLGRFGILVCREPKHWDRRYLSWECRQVCDFDSVESKAVKLSQYSTILPVHNATVDGSNHAPIQYVSPFPLNSTIPLPIYATSTNTSVDDDACNPLPGNTSDLSSVVVVIRRSTNCTLVKNLFGGSTGSLRLMESFATRKNRLEILRKWAESTFSSISESYCFNLSWQAEI